MKGAPALGFRMRFSPVLLGATLAMGVLAAWAVLLMAWPRWSQALGIAAIAACVASSAARQLRPRVTAMLWRTDGSVEVSLRHAPDAGRAVVGSVGAARVFGPLVVLTLRWPPRGREHIWVLPDNLDADLRRRLRMRLATGMAQPASANADSG